MPSTSFKTLALLLEKIWTNCRPMSALSHAGFRKVHHVLGDDAQINVAPPDGQPATLELSRDTCYGPSFVIVDDGYDALQAICHEYLKDPRCHDRLSTKAIQDAVIQRIRELRVEQRTHGPDFNQLARSTLTSLHGLLKFGTAYIPVDNLRLPDDVCLRIGGVILRPYKQVASHLESLFSQRGQLHPDPEQSDALKAMITKDVLPVLYGASLACAEVRLEAEAGRFRTLAERETDSAINLLRCYTHRLFPRNVMTGIGLKGMVFSSPRPCIADQPDLALSLTMEREGALLPFDLDCDRLTYLQRETLCPLLSSILGKHTSERSDLESGIALSIGWIGRGMNPLERPLQYLSLAIGIERLVLGPRAEIKKDALARRVAFLVGSEGGRRSLYRRVKALYTLRSGIVHDALAEVSDADLGDMQRIALLVLEAIANHSQRLSNYSALGEFLEATEFREI